MKRWRITIIVALVLIFNPITLVVAWLGSATWSNNHPETGAKLDAVDWLPPSATDISFYNTYSWRAWECSMEEDDFRRWASQYKLREIVDAQSIPRFSWLTARRICLDSGGSFSEEEEQKHIATVHRGLFATERRESGGGYHVVFDRETNRVYFQSNPR